MTSPKIILAFTGQLKLKNTIMSTKHTKKFTFYQKMEMLLGLA